MPTQPTSPGVPLDQYMATQVANPTLATTTTMTPNLLPTDTSTLQNQGQLLTGIGSTMQQVAPISAPATQPVATPITQTQATSSQIDPNEAVQAANLNDQNTQYQAATVAQNTPQAQAIQGVVNPLATVQGQLTALFAQTGIGEIPPWAAGSVTAANEAMAARGLGASTIGTAAIASAMQKAALPIAAADAATYFQMDMTNLNNQQQAEFMNIQMKQQSLLSDQSAVNAANQFNAASYAQVHEYLGTLVSNIMTQNADRNQAVNMFNSGQANTIGMQDVANQINVGQFTSNQQAAIDQFNQSQAFARDQFNAQAAFAIEQSNVTWRRNINTQNTAAINAANQTNVQNAFNLSQVAQNNLWQQWRDEVSYAFTESQNQAAMNFNMAMAANNQAFASPQTGFNWAQAAGSFAAGILI